MMPRVSLAQMMTLVVLLALDFAILAAVRADGRTSGDYAVGALPMTNAALWTLVVGLRGLRHGVQHPFLAGFTAFGIAAVIVYGAVCTSPWIGAYAQLSVDAMLAPLGGHQPGWLDLVVIGFVLSLPQFLFALAGGWVITELSGRRDDRDSAVTSST
jgi:hypothetical protein